MKRSKKKKNGFTLIELLAVIVILAILLAIAVPAVSNYITNSKRESYISAVKQFTDAVRKEITLEEYPVTDENTVYYINMKNIDTEKNSGTSPFAPWKEGYVVVTVKNNLFSYYWTSVDEKGWRVDLSKKVDELTRDDVYKSDNLTITNNKQIGGRDNIVVYEPNDQILTQISTNDQTKVEAEKCFTIKLVEGEYTITDYNKSCGTEVYVPSKIDGLTVTSIGENAFKKKGLTAVTMYEGITKIGYGAFQGNAIQNLKLSSTITTISDYAFYQNQIKELSLPEGVKTIGSYAFHTNKITTIRFPKTLTSIGGYAFGNNLLNEVNLESNPTISGGAFANNKMDEADAFIYAKKGDGTTDYSILIGYGGQQKNNFVIPATKEGVALKEIRGNALSSLGLTGTIVIPDTVQTIGGDAFAFNQITAVQLPSQLKTIGGTAFRSNKLTTIEIPPSVTSIGNGAFRQNNISGENEFIYARKSDGNIDYSTIVSWGKGSTSGPVTIPATKNGVTLKLIKNGAFRECNITKINLPDFSETPNLTVEDMAFTKNRVTGNDQFMYKIQNGKIDYSYLSNYSGVGSGTITIPEIAGPNDTPLNRIAGSLFSWMSYNTIVIPPSVTTIGSSAFSKDGRNNQNLKKIVNKTGRSFNWKSITASTEANTFVTGTIIHQAGNIEVVDK